MTLTCTNVTLRQKPLRNDRISLYLDYYPAIRNPETMQMSPQGIPWHLSLCQAKERAAKNVQSGHAEQSRGNPLYPCPVAYQ